MGTYHYAGNEATTPLALGQAILGEAAQWHKLAVQAPTPQAHAARPDASEEPQNAVLACKRFFTPSASSPAPGAPACRLYWTGSTDMADAPILITGGAGFIGSHLCDALLDKGYAVRVLDDFSTGKRANLRLDHPGLDLIEGDVADAELVRRATAGCRAVVHLAAVASVQASVEDPVRTHQSNFIGTLNVCEAMRRKACGVCCSPPARRFMATTARANRLPRTRPRRR